ncbi:uncharacterized protein (TIGR03083 family) [Allocatelliglobosispora scoriae]|uniref:Uncharacterized protein (TIGR03083 family) n=1 Tax=Allocatelliglobosispora scoriae TaxID=643052 RepID=A0A841BZU9_9ACTN|nr:maleylpyruvate isomerase family mycothiol-dependent enzyme [Allocatelliglobosispora scoriae]MBB5872629.1 uncharacterized protein (TIGR03083 family) [Allocatelliglobosispora scoriae]
MTLLGHGRYCDEIVAQTELLRTLIRGADLAVEVPTCPGWTLETLVRHIGGNLRTVETAVRTGEAVDSPAEQVAELTGPASHDPAAIEAWFAEGAARYVESMRKAGPDVQAQVWGIPWTTLPWVRRGLHDIVIHRLDASIALGVDYKLDLDLAADSIDELLELFTGLQAMGAIPKLADLRGLGESLLLVATDTGQSWHIDCGAEGFTWRQGEGRATVTLAGNLLDVLAVFYRRQPVTSPRVQVTGDTALLDFWLDRVSLT